MQTFDTFAKTITQMSAPKTAKCLTIHYGSGLQQSSARTITTMTLTHDCCSMLICFKAVTGDLDGWKMSGKDCGYSSPA